MKVATIVGARPQFMKMAVLHRAIQKYNQEKPSHPIQETLIHTGQHYDHGMSQVFFEEMGLPTPEINLNIRSSLQGEMTGAMITSLERQLIANRPDCVLVFGDTNSTLAGGLAASKLNIPVAHVESGLRSFNRKMPEEINRIVADNVSEILFCPCQNAVDQLLKENITENVFLSGDVLYDSFLHYKRNAISPEKKEPFALATIHRAENTDDPERLRLIFAALKNCPIPVVISVHPRTQKELKYNQIALDGSIECVEPLSYFSMLGYLSRCSFVITDSGGLQKEAYFSEKKCLIAREETEWIELLECGASQLVGPLRMENQDIQDAFEWALKPPKVSKNIYGDGNAGNLIVEKIAHLIS
jgi:UDP-GlcNAc3NAcA epimerase